MPKRPDDQRDANAESVERDALGQAESENAASDREYRLLLELAARGEMSRADSPFYTDERFLTWLDDELRSKYRVGEGWSRAKITSVARRIEAKVEAARLRVACAAGHPPAEPASVTGTIAQIRELAAAERAAPLLDLAAAAGPGRELWDEPCERWIRLPVEMPRGEYVALRVRGDSMLPLLHDGDTVLVKKGASVAKETVAVARHPEDGYVIKRVAGVNSSTIELASLNPAYRPLRILRRPDAVIGRVVLRWCPHGDIRPKLHE